VGLVGVVGTLWGAGAYSQVLPSPIPPETAEQKRANVSFEVESVKENLLTRQEAGPPHLSMSVSGLFVATRKTVHLLIMTAYDVRTYQVVGGPKWMDSTLFDVVAKAPDDFEMGQTRGMLRHLLADRFGLLVHQEMRVMPTYSLEWANRKHKLGPGIRPSSTATCDDSRSLLARSGAIPPPAGHSSCGSMAGWGDGIFVRRASLASLVQLLTIATGGPVTDKTGLTGMYDVDVKGPGLVPGSPQGGPNLDQELEGGGSIFTVVREQLGLKLESTKGPVDVLVIDHAEQPTPD
jgi:uncharacterized protein (TIGR03435 family)